MNKLWGLVAVIYLGASYIGVLNSPLQAQTLQGDWQPFEGHLNGQVVPADNIALMSLKIEQGRFDAKSGDLMSNGNLQVFDQVVPAQVVFSIDSGDDAGREIKAIYTLSGSQLTIVFSQTDEFPSDFVSTPTNRNLVMKYNKGQTDTIVRGPGGEPLPRFGKITASSN